MWYLLPGTLGKEVDELIQLLNGIIKEVVSLSSAITGKELNQEQKTTWSIKEAGPWFHLLLREKRRN